MEFCIHRWFSDAFSIYSPKWDEPYSRRILQTNKKQANFRFMFAADWSTQIQHKYFILDFQCLGQNSQAQYLPLQMHEGAFMKVLRSQKTLRCYFSLLKRYENISSSGTSTNNSLWSSQVFSYAFPDAHENRGLSQWSGVCRRYIIILLQASNAKIYSILL